MAVALLSACATGTANLTNLDQAEWEAALRARRVDPKTVPDPIAYTPAMQEEAERLAGVTGSPGERLKRLQSALFDPEMFPFSYELRGTLTAAEAFYRRQGNCLSFTNLFVAMGRSLGIPVTTALVTRILGSEREDDLIVVNTHVVASFSESGDTTYFDFDRTRRRQPTALRELDDLWITALYLNNRGADELRIRHPEVAVKLFTDAVRLAPEFAAAWGNVGVARRRVGDITGAFDAYDRALELEPHNPTVLSNLAGLYRSIGRDAEADAALEAANYTHASPHQLLVRGDLELARGNTEEAVKLYKQAKRIAPRLPEVWLALARAELSRSRPDRAEHYIERALKIAPDDPRAKALAAAVRNEVRTRS